MGARQEEENEKGIWTMEDMMGIGRKYKEIKKKRPGGGKVNESFGKL